MPERGPDGSVPSPCPQKPAASRQPELGELAAFLGRADPWYQNTVNTLCPAIHKLAEMVGAAREGGWEGCGRGPCQVLPLTPDLKS